MIEVIFSIVAVSGALLGIGLFVNIWKLWGLLIMKRKFNQFRLNSSIKLGGSDSNNYTCVLENNVLKNPSTAAIQGQI